VFLRWRDEGARKQAGVEPRQVGRAPEAPGPRPADGLPHDPASATAPAPPFRSAVP